MSLLRRRIMASSMKESDVPTEELDYLTIIPLHEGEVEYKIYPYGGTSSFSVSPIFTQDMPFYYRINKGEWVEVNLPDSIDLAFTIILTKDTELQLKCMGCNYSYSYIVDHQMFRIITDGTFNLNGTPMSLLYGDGFKENNYVPIELLPGLFLGNSGLVQILNPKTFLPYTKLGEYCYGSMFSNCTSLIVAPELPATKLVDFCYFNMFRGCTNLSYIKMLATDISALNCLSDWVSGVSSTGTFVKSKNATWDTTPGALGYDGVPAGWTVVDDGEQSGSNIGIEFPLYLTFDECTTNWVETECVRYADDISKKLFEVLKDVINQYGESDVVTGQILELLGIEIYIENSKITDVQYYNIQSEEMQMNTEDGRTTTFISDGTLIQNYIIN